MGNEEVRDGKMGWEKKMKEEEEKEEGERRSNMEKNVAADTRMAWAIRLHVGGMRRQAGPISRQRPPVQDQAEAKLASS